jgi:phage terminase large subunit-like protein
MQKEIRDLAENDLLTFIKLVDPQRVLGACHEELIRWWERPGAKNHQMVLFPRDHMKSALVGYRVAQYLAKNPTARILYISATANLAEKQLGFIKTILTCPIFKRYWPHHVNEEEGKREKWTNSEISLDHPDRKKENIRDPSIFTGGLTTSLTGLHCDIAVLDDVVVFENAYTNEGRDKTRRQYSLLSSIEGVEAKEWVVGTRYHPKDLYADLLKMSEDIYDKSGTVIGSEPIYEVLQKEVEDSGDGTGQFLWPRQMRKDGKWFGFDSAILSKKRGQYLDRTQFRAQYYNNPTDPDSQPIAYDRFQYYDRKFLRQENGYWNFKGKRLNLVASVDFAYSIRKGSDYTAIVVLGLDSENNYYVLDIDRFQTDSISEYFNHILALYNKWSFRKLIAETTAAQNAIVQSLKDNYIKPNGMMIKVDEVKPNRHQGSKEERMEATLSPLYDNLQVYHYQGGHCQTLEEELVSYSPPHDDIKDALAIAIGGAVKPMQNSILKKSHDTVVWNTRFGGRAF